MSKNQQILAKIGGGSLALLLSLGLGQQASAVTLVENLTQPTDGGSSVGTWRGSSFTTGSGSYSLESVTLLFQENTADLNNLFVRLYGNNSGVPGTLITTFTNPASITTSFANNTFTLTTPQALTANTTYWLVSGILLGGTGTGDYDWGFTDSPDQTGLPDWTIGNNYVNSFNQGASWNPNNTGSWKFSVNGTEQSQSIPEPSSLVALLGLGGLGLVSRLKKRK